MMDIFYIYGEFVFLKGITHPITETVIIESKMILFFFLQSGERSAPNVMLATKACIACHIRSRVVLSDKRSDSK